MRLAGLITMAKYADLLGLLAFRNIGKQTQLIREFLNGLAVVIALTIISGMLVGALLVGGLYAFYHVLVSYNMQPGAALWLTAGIAVVLTALVVSLTLSAICRLGQLPKQIMEASAPIATKTNGIINSFLDGLSAGHAPKGKE
jgi:hypothetical protein